MTYKVIVEVMGGVAYVTECPPEVEVEIRDYDVPLPVEIS